MSYIAYTAPGRSPIIVYTVANCVQCDQTKKTFKKAGVKFSEVDLTNNPDLLDVFKKQGFQSAPVVLTNQDSDQDSWSGFRPDKIKKAIEVYNKNKLKGKI